MKRPLEVVIEPELMEALSDLSREQDRSVAELIRIALREFIWNLEEDLEISRMEQGAIQSPGEANL